MRIMRIHNIKLKRLNMKLKKYWIIEKRFINEYK